MVNPRVFHDYAVVGEQVTPLGRVVFELFSDKVPKTAENFRALCTGSAGVNSIGIPLWYKGSPLHRVIAGFMVQGGDFTDRNGKGGESIYGPSFEDENLTREIDSEGLLCMANKGKNTNSSQFFVTLRPCPHLKGKHVVLGRVVKGFETIVAISKMAVDAKDRPLELITIQHCGELERKVVAKPPPPPSSSSSSSGSLRSRSRSRSLSPDRSRSKRSRSRSHSHRHRSRHSDDEDDATDSETEERDRRRRHRSSSEKKKKHHRSSHRSSKHGGGNKSASSSRKDWDRSPSGSPELTSEQIAELEKRAREEAEEAEKRREEEEREAVEKAKRAKEERERYEREQIARGGIIYKGSGRMKAGREEGRSGMRGW